MISLEHRWEGHILYIIGAIKLRSSLTLAQHKSSWPTHQTFYALLAPFSVFHHLHIFLKLTTRIL